MTTAGDDKANDDEAIDDEANDDEANDDETDEDGDAAFLRTVALAVRAQRRRLRLDQRALAARAGVSKSTVAKVERGDGATSLPMLRRVLAEVGLDVVLVDKDGCPWRDGDALPADMDGAVDEANRRLPAHLPATLTDDLKSWDFCRARRWWFRAPLRWRYDRYSDDLAALLQEAAAERAARARGPGTASRADAEGAPDPWARRPFRRRSGPEQ